MQHANDNQPPRLISIKEVCEITSLSRTSADNFRFAKKFPADVRLGSKRIPFVRSEVIQWIEDRMAERNQV